MPKSIETTCVISGGGPAGIMLGYLLARAGIDVTILEKWPDFFRDFRGDTVHPSTMDVLKELGLLEEFLALPHSEMTEMDIHFNGRRAVMADLSHLRAACPFIAFVPQWDFLTFLAKKGSAFDTFHLMMATEATDLIMESGRAAGVRAQSADGEFEIRAPLVVGADGRHSTIRGKGGFVAKESGAPIDVLWFRVSQSGVDRKQSLGYVAAGGALVMLDRHDYWQCAYLIQKGAFEEVKARGLDAFRASVAEMAGLSPEQVAEIDSWDKVKFLSVSIDHVDGWAHDGVLIIGDAAHAMSPIGGVGINYAVQDAVAAANILAPALKDACGTVPLATLERVEARRALPARKMQRVQRYIQDRVLSPVLSQRGRLKPPFLLRLFAWFPFLRRIPARVIGIGFLPERVDPDIFA